MEKEDEVKYAAGVDDASSAGSADASSAGADDGVGLIHSIAKGESMDYREMCKVKVLVDRAFKEVADGKINPKVALMALSEDLRLVLARY